MGKEIVEGSGEGVTTQIKKAKQEVKTGGGEIGRMDRRFRLEPPVCLPDVTRSNACLSCPFSLEVVEVDPFEFAESRVAYELLWPLTRHSPTRLNSVELTCCLYGCGLFLSAGRYQVRPELHSRHDHLVYWTTDIDEWSTLPH